MTFICRSIAETANIAQKFASKLSGNEVVAFYGDLGAGKTTFIRALVESCGSEDYVCSPTFAIMNEYQSAKFKIYHFDMYRISTLEDLETTGFFDFLGKGLVLIEWSENIEREIPNDAIKVIIEKTDKENERVIKFEGVKF